MAKKEMTAEQFIAKIRSGETDFTKYGKTNIRGALAIQGKNIAGKELNLGSLQFKQEFSIYDAETKLILPDTRFENGTDLEAIRIECGNSYFKGNIRINCKYLLFESAHFEDTIDVAIEAEGGINLGDATIKSNILVSGASIKEFFCGTKPFYGDLIHNDDYAEQPLQAKLIDAQANPHLAWLLTEARGGTIYTMDAVPPHMRPKVSG